MSVSLWYTFATRFLPKIDQIRSVGMILGIEKLWMESETQNSNVNGIKKIGTAWKKIYQVVWFFAQTQNTYTLITKSNHHYITYLYSTSL